MNGIAIKNNILNTIHNFSRDSIFRSTIIRNINLDLCDDNQKRAVIIYINQNLLVDVEGQELYRTNILEMNQILKVFINLNYSIDLIHCQDFDNVRNLMEKSYAIIFGFGNNFHSLCKNNPMAKKIMYVTENHPKISYEKEKERVDYFYNRHRRKIEMDRSFKYYKEEHFDLVDHAIILGEVTPYEKYEFDKSVISPTGFYNKNYVLKKRNFEVSKRNFLWFGSNGAIHKGLDLLIDIFKHREDIVLHVCGLNDKDSKLLNFAPKFNIINYGKINVQSEKFLELVNTCSFVVLPSCSEGFSTSITTCMRHSMIPIVMKDTGFNRLEEKAFFLESYKLEYIEKELNSIININDELINEMHKEIYEFANKEFLLKNFNDKFKAIINNIDKGLE